MPRERDRISGLQGYQKDLIAFGELSGLEVDPAIYRFIVELLSLQIDPDAIYKLLRHIRRTKSTKQNNA